MKQATFALSLCLLLFTVSIQAQEKPAADDSATVRATVADYIEAYYTGDARRMQQTLHPHYLKHMIHGNIPVREKTGAQMVEAVRNGVPADLPASERTEQITVLDISGTIASAKLTTPHWVDYITLAKSEGAWKILSVVQRIDN
jgi:hypothetical protein